MARNFNKQHSSIIYQIPKSLEFLDEEDEKRKCIEFKEELINFHKKHLLNENFKVPSIGGKELDLCKLYKAVYVRGGSVQVSSRKLWKEIVNEFQIPSSCTSASFTLRNHYNRCLLAYENKCIQQHQPEMLQQASRGIAGPGPGRPVGSGNVSTVQTGHGSYNTSGMMPPPQAQYGASHAQNLNQPFQSQYKELGHQNIFATTQVAHHPNSGPGGSGSHGLGLAPGQHFGYHQNQYNSNQASSSAQNPPYVSSTMQNYRYNLPNHLHHLPDYRQNLQIFQKRMHGRVQSALGGDPSAVSNDFLPVAGPGQAYIEKAMQESTLANQIGQLSSAASLNFKAKDNYTLKVQLAQTEAESKRLVLAFESRQTNEINWALNTLAIFSCNTNQNFTLENQPYLLESMANYMVHCIENIYSLSYSDPLEKRARVIGHQVPSFVDAFQTNQTSNENMGVGQNTLEYKNWGTYTSQQKKRDFKFDEKQAAKRGYQTKEDGAMSAVAPRSRGRKPIYIKQQEQNALDELRKKRKRLVTVLHQEVTEIELIEHLRMIVLVIRNLTFIRSNEHHVVKCFKLVDIITSLFVDLLDTEITLNCLDIITNIAKHVVLSEINCGHLLVQALFTLFSSGQYLSHGESLYVKQSTVDQCIECLRRLSLSAGNEEYLEEVSDKQIQSLVNLLLAKNLETREGCLEILCTISDRKTALKVRIAHQKRCIERLIGLVATGSLTPSEEKISKLAALTLANLNLAPSNRCLIVPYEQELALIASSDEKTCKIVSEILGDLDSYQVYAK